MQNGNSKWQSLFFSFAFLFGAAPLTNKINTCYSSALLFFPSLSTDGEDLRDQESVSRVLAELLDNQEGLFDSEDDDVSTTNDYSSINEQVTSPKLLIYNFNNSKWEVSIIDVFTHPVETKSDKWFLTRWREMKDNLEHNSPHLTFWNLWCTTVLLSHFGGAVEWGIYVCASMWGTFSFGMTHKKTLLLTKSLLFQRTAKANLLNC